MSEYVPSFPFYDAEPYWYKNRQGSGGNSGGSVLPSFGSLSNIGCVIGNTIVNQFPMPIDANIVMDDDVVIDGVKSQIASGLHVVVPTSHLELTCIATLTKDANDVDVIGSYTEMDPSTIGLGEGNFTMPALPDNQALIFVYNSDPIIS